MKRKICTKQNLLDLGIEVKETSEKGKYEIYRNGKQLTRYEFNAYKKYGRTITYLGYSIYLGIVDTPKGKKSKQVNILEHVIIWLWYNNIIPDNMDIDHIDNNKLNNDITNLQLLTRRDNLRKRGIGRNQYSYHLTDDEILELRQRNKQKHKKREK